MKKQQNKQEIGAINFRNAKKIFPNNITKLRFEDTMKFYKNKNVTPKELKAWEQVEGQWKNKGFQDLIAIRKKKRVGFIDLGD